AVGALLPTAEPRGAPPRLARIVSADQGPVWTMAAGRVMTFKLLGEQAAGHVSVFEELVPVAAGTPLHIHHTSEEVSHLLAGELTIKLGTEVTTISAGAWVFIPRGSVHGWKNSGHAPALASYMFVPSIGAKVFEEARLLGPIPTSDPVTMAKFDTLCRRYGY